MCLSNSPGLYHVNGLNLRLYYARLLRRASSPVFSAKLDQLRLIFSRCGHQDHRFFRDHLGTALLKIVQISKNERKFYQLTYLFQFLLIKTRFDEAGRSLGLVWLLRPLPDFLFNSL